MSTNQEVSFYILHLASLSNISVCNLKLQKLLYYCQGFSLGITKQKLFADPIEAWDHGPVVRSVYHDYKHFGKGNLPVPQSFDDSVFDEIQKDIIKSVVNVFGVKTAWELRQMTHREPIWLAHSANDKGDGTEISVMEIMEFFSKNLSIDNYFKAFKQSFEDLQLHESLEIPSTINSAEEFIAWVRN